MPRKVKIRKKLTLYCAIFTLSLAAIWAISSTKIHNFEGQCQTCHANIPDENNPAGNLIFIDDIDKLCARCHDISRQKSHPINITPAKDIPLKIHLDKNGRLTCSTCHDVHKEDKTQNKSELSALLWGHTKGRAFCSLCHDEKTLETGWKHQTAIPYAHAYGKFTENTGGAKLDKYSIECLSCHDDTISNSPQMQIKQGVWQHRSGGNHPVGVDYPNTGDFTDTNLLPKEIRLFNGTIGCLSCHEVYGKEQKMLSLNNKKSRLCLACHKK